ncbi:MAG: hypothetical protein WAO95_14180 [Burkholderiales bacterium]
MLRYLKETTAIKRSAEADVWYAKSLHRFFSGRVLLEVKRADVREYIALRKSEGLKGATINREVGLLSSAINRARFDWDWAIPNPAQSMRESEGEGRRGCRRVISRRCWVTAPCECPSVTAIWRPRTPSRR